MTKRKVTQLFTAIVLAASAPAAAAVSDARITPLRLPSSAPAPGNVLAKGEKPMKRETKELRAESKKRKAERAARAAVAKATRPITKTLKALLGPEAVPVMKPSNTNRDA